MSAPVLVSSGELSQTGQLTRQGIVSTFITLSSPGPWGNRSKCCRTHQGLGPPSHSVRHRPGSSCIPRISLRLAPNTHSISCTRSSTGTRKLSKVSAPTISQRSPTRATIVSLSTHPACNELWIQAVWGPRCGPPIPRPGDCLLYHSTPPLFLQNVPPKFPRP